MADYDPTDPKCVAGVEAALGKMKSIAKEKWWGRGYSAVCATSEEVEAALLPAPPTLLAAAQALLAFRDLDGDDLETCIRGSTTMDDDERIGALLDNLRAAVEREKGGDHG